MNPPDPASRAEQDHRVRAYVAVLVALALALVATTAYRPGADFGPDVLIGTVVAAVVLLLADAFPVRVSERHEVNVVDVGLVVSVAVLGPLWAAAAALPLAVLPARRDPLRAAYEASCTTAEVCLGGAVFSLVSGPLLSGASSGPVVPVVYGTLLAGATMVGANHAANAGLLRIKYRTSARAIWADLGEPYLIPHVLNVLTAGLSVLALLTLGPAAAVLLVAGSVASQALVYRTREHAEENRALRTEVASLRKDLGDAGASFGAMIVGDLGQKDGYTDRHAAATATYAADLGREMGLDEARVGLLRTAGLLNNIGMFGLPEEILTETGKPNSVARARLAEHPARGERVLRSVRGFEEAASWVRWHHERPDGRGYPDKLRGAWIPAEAKILAVAQAYAAMVLDQPRRPGLGPEGARRELSRGAETQFDGAVVKAFLRILDTEPEGYKMADDHRFSPPGGEASASPSAPGP